MEKILNKRNILITIGIFAVIRIVLALFYYNYDDLYTFNFLWLKTIDGEGIFNIYKEGMILKDYPVDYPPLFLIMLGIISKPVLIFQNNPYIFQLLMKLPALIFDFSIIIFLYRKVNAKVALLWAVNLAAIVNSGMWGQTDNILIFFIILMFYYIYNKKQNMAAVLAAVCCLTKLQGIYIAPIYLIYIIFEKISVKDKLKSIMCAFITGISVWIPFCIASKDILLPFKIYFGGFGKYKEMCAGAANFWFFVVRKIYDGNQFLNILSYVLLLICIFLLVYSFLRTKNIYISSALYLFMIYMITFAQRERYGIYFMTLFLIVYIVNKNKTMLKMYLTSIFINGIISLGFLVQKNYDLTYTYTGIGSNYIKFLPLITFSWLVSVVVMFVMTFILFRYVKKNYKEE